jgi:simple sugar transport system ATP-binding protein
MSPPAARLALSGVTKRYPGVVANESVALEVAPGEIHAVLGENGAGKSTLMKIIYGAVTPDAGELRWNGAPVQLRGPEQARALGIAMVFQHFSLFESLSVLENVWLAHPERTRQSVLADLRERARDYGLPVEPDWPVHALSVGERQRVELLRALLGRPELLILDEPTSVLSPQAAAQLFVMLRKLAAEGCSILYISHKLDEIRALCDRCTVLRKGRVVGRITPATHSRESLSRLMIGSEPRAVTRKPRAAGELVLGVHGLSLPPVEAYGVALRDIELEVRAGEIVGIAGVSGNGQSQLMAAVSGEDLRAPRGSLRVLGQDVTRSGPRARRALGVRCVPEERLGRGAVPGMSLAHNSLLTRDQGIGRAGLLDMGALLAFTERLIRQFGVEAPSAAVSAQALSGGNLQKLIVGRELDAAPRLLLASQPTWGVDVGAAADIRAALLALRDAGSALLVVSEELEELSLLCDRLHVMAGGRLSPALPIEDATVEVIGAYMSGLWPGEPARA